MSHTYESLCMNALDSYSMIWRITSCDMTPSYYVLLHMVCCSVCVCFAACCSVCRVLQCVSCVAVSVCVSLRVAVYVVCCSVCRVLQCIVLQIMRYHTRIDDQIHHDTICMSLTYE